MKGAHPSTWKPKSLLRKLHSTLAHCQLHLHVGHKCMNNRKKTKKQLKNYLIYNLLALPHC